jgi:hypothetical protein
VNRPYGCGNRLNRERRGDPCGRPRSFSASDLLAGHYDEQGQASLYTASPPVLIITKPPACRMQAGGFPFTDAFKVAAVIRFAYFAE